MQELKDLIYLDLDIAGFTGLSTADIVFYMQDFNFTSSQTKEALVELVVKDQIVTQVPSGKFKLKKYLPV
jgi:hypothetical protein